MALLDNLQSILGGQAQGQAPSQGGSPIASLLAPAALGGLMGALMSNKKARKITGNVLLVGGGAALATVLWNKYKNRGSSAAASAAYAAPQTAPAPGQAYAQQAAPQIPASAFSQPAPGFAPAGDLNAKATRLIRAMIFAAKSDGVVDQDEQAAIQQTIHQLGLGQDAEAIISRAMNEPLDPRAIAQGVASQEEALEVYLVSSSVIEVDHFMESSYLEALARELGIPPELTRELAAEIEKARQAG